MKHILLFIFLMLLGGCVDAGSDKNVQDLEEQSEISTNFSNFFKPADSTSYFLGEGNEFASYTVKTVWLSEKYVANVVDNGGATRLHIYRVLEEKIDKVYEENLEGLPNEVQFPTISTLDDLPAIGTYLSGPIKVGTKFDNWTIVEVDLTVETYYETFENVFVIEEVGENFINRRYFVEGFGEIKSESIMKTDHNEEIIVTSTLESITVQ